MIIRCALLLAAGLLPLAAARPQGVGPAYWQDPSAHPTTYPAAAQAQAAAEGYIVTPAGTSAMQACNSRLVKPVCVVGGLWVQNRCIAALQGLVVQPDVSCAQQPKDVFAGAPSAQGAAPQPPAPVTSLDFAKYSAKGFVFRGVASRGAPSSWRLNAHTQAYKRVLDGVVEQPSGFWWSARQQPK